MKRQGLKVTIWELRSLANELEQELEDKDLYPSYATTNQIIHQINIINKDGASDGWEIE